MKKINPFVLVNVICTLIFCVSFFGMIDWALAAIIFMGGVGLSVLIGCFIYSKAMIRSLLVRWVFALGTLAIGYVFLKVGEYLNQTYYDGLVTLSVLAYVVVATVFLHYLGKQNTTAH